MRFVYRFWAWFGGYFALPCPTCGEEFYGFQHRRCGSIPHPNPAHGAVFARQMICPRCTATIGNDDDSIVEMCNCPKHPDLHPCHEDNPYAP